MSKITLTQTAQTSTPAQGSTSLFVKQDQQLYLMLDTGVEKKVGADAGQGSGSGTGGSGGGSAASVYLPAPEVRVVNPLSYVDGGAEANSHDALFALLPSGFDERFYEHAPEIWLFRYVKRRKGGKLSKKWVHPTHRNGTLYADGSPRARSYYDGGAHNLNYGYSTHVAGAPLSYVHQPLAGRSTEWVINPLYRQAGQLIPLALEPWLWFAGRADDPAHDSNMPVLAPQSFTLGADYQINGKSIHAFQPLGRSRRVSAGQTRALGQLFALRLVIRNPSTDAAELAARPRVFSGLSAPFRLRILSASPHNGARISYRYLL